jgi:hypothetical protein
MTDLEISKALALAIGWKPKQLGYGIHYINDCVGIPERLAPDSGESRVFYDDVNANGWCVVFDYLDWNVIGPIAARYDCFPMVAAWHADQWAIVTDKVAVFADTPQKAIAMAVIEGAKK